MRFLLKTFLFSSLLINLNVYAGPTEEIRDYSAKVREASISFSKLVKKASGNKDIIKNNNKFQEIADKFNLSDRDQSRVAQAIADGNTSVVTALYASMAAKELLIANKTDVQGLDEGISDVMKVASIAGKGVSTDPTLKMTPDEMKDASSALKKKTEYSIDMLSWGKEDADVHIAVMKKTAQIYDALKVTPEEALVLAIMEVKGVDKSGAMKIIRKLRDCV
jgi:hypothetical protein